VYFFDSQMMDGGVILIDQLLINHHLLKHDTFRFDIELPRNVDQNSRIEFCVCYVANGVEFWDSNVGKNFILTSPTPETPLPPPSTTSNTDKQNGHRLMGLDKDDAYRFNYNDYTTFASWKNLSTQTPYW